MIDEIATLGEHVTAAFSDRFGESPRWLIRAPGRVNLIGEHTDYNDGFVMPMAIDRAVWIALRPREDGQVRVWSLDYEEEAGFDLTGFERGSDAWIEYLKACAWALQERDIHLSGWEGVLAGDVPHGAGLSSSAALELATLRAFSAASGIPWDAREMALAGQRAENEWVGVNCGIMDQMISARGEEGHALLIDCRTLEAKAVPLPTGTLAVILDTATRRGLVDSAYNERRAQCEEAARILGAKALRDVSAAELEAAAHLLDPTTRKRARHVVTENERTLAASAALRDGDAIRVGQLMNESHASLRDDFEVSTKALDLFSELARKAEGCYGARMTGAGFGGCAVALVAEDAAPRFVKQVAAEYQAATGLTPSIYVSGASEGAQIVQAAPAVSVQPAGFWVGDREVEIYTLTSSTGLELRVMTYGGIVLSLLAPDRDGTFADVTLGYATPLEYLDNPAYLGAIAGRYANRIAGGRFSIEDRTYQLDLNDGANHLHGGNRGLDATVWEARPFRDDRACGIELSCASPAGQGGYPGNLEVRVTYTLTGNEWSVEYHATTDEPTPVNLTQHTYFNLAGTGSIKDHLLHIAADRFIPVSQDGIPTGDAAPVEGTPFDFRTPRAIGERVDASNPDLEAVGGYDHSFWLNDDPSFPSASLTDPKTGRTLTVQTNEPGIQLYTANHLTGIPGKAGIAYNARDGVCLETQHFPDSPNRPTFPTTILRPGETFTSRTVFTFSALPATRPQP